jgi:hypothetical protein
MALKDPYSSQEDLRRYTNNEVYWDTETRCYVEDAGTPYKKAAYEKQVGGDHYKTLAIQPIDYIRQNHLGWCEGNIVKYITRHKQKGEAKDIEKVIHYAELILEEYKNA